MSGSEYELLRRNKIQWLINQQKAGGKLDFVNTKHKVKLTEAKSSTVVKEWKTLP